MATDSIKPPVNELGHSGGYESSLDPRTGGRKYQVVSQTEVARELHFPDSVVVYDAMRVETQLAGVLEAIVQPVMNAAWHLEGEGVPDNVVEFVRTELGLPSEDAPLSRTYHNGINIIDHIAEMVETMLWAGFSCAEQLYDVSPPTPIQEGLGAGTGDLVVHLRKLSPRPPRTITKIETAQDGGLTGIRQTPLNYEFTVGVEDTFIPVESLVFYSHKRRGGAWQGESVLRPAYRPWALKDIYLRLDAQAVDKHSSGYWKATTNDKNRAAELFTELGEMRTGERGVIVTDVSDQVELLGLNGTLVDITPRLNYLDQQMSRSALAMFLDLGHDNGARSLGETHLKIFYTKVKAIADHIGRVVTDHVIRDLVRYNFPDGTPYPALTPGDVVAQQGTTAEVIGSLLRDGGLTYDRGMEDYLRGRYGIPALGEPEEEEAPEDTTDPNADLEREKTEAEILNTKTAAAGIAFRIGYDAENLRDAYGLPSTLEHPGWLPTTIKSVEKFDMEDEAAEADALAQAAKGAGAVLPDGNDDTQDTGGQNPPPPPPRPRAVAATADRRTAVQRATEAYNELMLRVSGRV